MCGKRGGCQERDVLPEARVFRDQKATKVTGAWWGLGPQGKGGEEYRGHIMGGLGDPDKKYLEYLSLCGIFQRCI